MESGKVEPYIRLLVWEAIVPLRTSASDSAEQSSQLFFGEQALLLEEQPNWYRLRRLRDGYEGWADAKMFYPLADSDTLSISPPTSFSLGGHLLREDGSLMALPIGPPLPIEVQTGIFNWAGEKLEATKSLRTTAVRPSSEWVATATLFMNAPYLWGGISNWGIDCSGLMQTSAAMCGITLPRDSSQQAECGVAIEYGKQQAGDLAFFAKPNKKKITHVGLLRDSESIIHASGRVRIDRLSPQGIVHSQNQQITHHLISIRRC